MIQGHYGSDRKATVRRISLRSFFLNLSRQQDLNCPKHNGMDNNNSLSPFRIPARGSKVPPGTGFSNYDWLQKSFPQRAPVRVSTAELAMHKSEGDVWIAIQGRVYDITQYVSYHPGGKYQILRGKGIDATDLFFKAHPCMFCMITAGVNPEALLGKCWIGFLVREHS